MDPKATALIERAKRAIATRPDDERTAALVAEARKHIGSAPAWQDVTAIRNY